MTLSTGPILDTTRTSGSRIAVALFTRIIFSFVLNFRHEKRDAESIPCVSISVIYLTSVSGIDHTHNQSTIIHGVDDAIIADTKTQ